MGEDTATYLVNFLGFACFLWLGLYVVARGDRGNVALLTGATSLGLSTTVHPAASAAATLLAIWCSG